MNKEILARLFIFDRMVMNPMGIGFGAVISPIRSVRKHRYIGVSVFFLHRQHP